MTKNSFVAEVTFKGNLVRLSEPGIKVCWKIGVL